MRGRTFPSFPYSILHIFVDKSEKKQGKKCTYNVTLWGVRLNIFPKKLHQYNLFVFLSYMSLSTTTKIECRLTVLLGELYGQQD